jgi:arylsulfatase
MLDGRSLVPLLLNPKANWPDRLLFTHLGRWPKGKVEESKFHQCAVRSARFRLVNNAELYDLQNDSGESKNVIEQHPEVVAALRTAYDNWWISILPCLINEDAVAPKINPFKTRYWRQFGGGPDAAMLKAVDPEQVRSPGDAKAAQAK